MRRLWNDCCTVVSLGGIVGFSGGLTGCSNMHVQDPDSFCYIIQDFPTHLCYLGCIMNVAVLYRSHLQKINATVAHSLFVAAAL